MKFAVLGDAFVDIVVQVSDLPQWGMDTECLHPIVLHPGGSALNTATHLSALVGSTRHENRLEPENCVELHTVIGKDYFGGILRQHLKQNHILLPSRYSTSGATGVCTVFSGSTDRGFATYYGALRKFNVESLDQDSILEADHLHIGGYYSCPGLRKHLIPLLQKAREKNMTISLDTNYDSSGQWDISLTTVLEHVDVFLPNDLEAKSISRCDTVKEALEFFANYVKQIVVIKMGVAGVQARCCKTGRMYYQSSFDTKIEDVTGAGDAFNAGFLYEWKERSREIDEALRWGCATASKCVSQVGACSSIYGRNEIKALLARQKVLKPTAKL